MNLSKSRRRPVPIAGPRNTDADRWTARRLINRFRTVGGALVEQRERPGTADSDWQCLGCGCGSSRSDSGYNYRPGSAANEHAGSCRALPGTRDAAEVPDPMAVLPATAGPWPWARAKGIDADAPYLFGRNADGTRVHLPVGSLFIAGDVRDERSGVARLAAASAALDPHAVLHIACGQADPDWQLFGHVAHRLVLGDTDDHVKALGALLDEAHAAMTERRHAVEHATAGTDWTFAPVRVVLDDLHPLIGGDRRHWHVDSRIRELVADGEAVNVTVTMSTATTAIHEIDYRAREAFRLRFGSRAVKQWSDTILGPGHSARGADTTRIPADHPGLGLLVDGTGSARPVAAHGLSASDLDRICRTARDRRTRAGTLTGSAADGPSPDAS